MNFQNQVDWGELNGVDVLAGVKAPEPLSLETLKSFIMMRCGLLTPLYSEPETMASAITIWFNVNAYGISKMMDLASTEYLPLENYRRVEEGSRSSTRARGETESGSKSLTRAREESENSERDLSRTTGDTERVTDNETTSDGGTISDEYTNSTEKTVSAYNESDYSPDEKTDSTGNNVRTIDTERTRDQEKNTTRSGTLGDDENTRRNLTENIQDTGQDSRNLTENVQDSGQDRRLAYGNIGTMTSQDMFNQELDLLERFNPYEWIVAKMENELFLSLW